MQLIFMVHDLVHLSGIDPNVILYGRSVLKPNYPKAFLKRFRTVSTSERLLASRLRGPWPERTLVSVFVAMRYARVNGSQHCRSIHLRFRPFFHP